MHKDTALMNTETNTSGFYLLTDFFGERFVGCAWKYTLLVKKGKNSAAPFDEVAAGFVVVAVHRDPRHALHHKVKQSISFRAIKIKMSNYM